MAFLSAAKPNLQTQDISHGLGGFFLCRGSDMCVGIQSKPGGEVSQHTGHGLDIHTVLERDGGEGGVTTETTYCSRFTVLFPKRTKN